MPNGRDIIGSTFFGATQTALILPYPNRQGQYYLFSARSFEDSITFVEETQTSEIVPTGLYYSVVDTRIDGGKGDIVVSSKNTLLHNDNTGLITAVPKPSSKDYWLITCEYTKSRLVVYPVTSRGIGKPKYLDLELLYGEDDIQGCIKPSPDGKKLVFLTGNRSRLSQGTDPIILYPIELYDFDPANGIISNRRTLGEYPNLVSASFSPDNTKLYISHFRESNSPNYSDFPPLLQFDLAAGTVNDIIASKTSIAWNTDFRVDTPIPSYTLQLAPDGRLYNAGYTILSNGQNNRQSVIFYLDKPNLKGNAVEPSLRFMDSPNNTFLNAEGISFSPQLLFPNFPQSYFNGLEPVNNFVVTSECQDAGFKLSNNPTEDFISIIADSESCLLPAMATVYSSLGQMLDEIEVVSKSTHLDFRWYSTGMYLLTIRTKEKASTFKVLKE